MVNVILWRWGTAAEVSAPAERRFNIRIMGGRDAGIASDWRLHAPPNNEIRSRRKIQMQILCLEEVGGCDIQGNGQLKADIIQLNWMLLLKCSNGISHLGKWFIQRDRRCKEYRLIVTILNSLKHQASTFKILTTVSSLKMNIKYLYLFC